MFKNKKELREPSRKSDEQLSELLRNKIIDGQYVFKRHARIRQKDRGISDLEVLDILEGKSRTKRSRNIKREKYEPGREDWNYCIEGINLDKKKIRVIVSIENGIVPIITVMWIE